MYQNDYEEMWIKAYEDKLINGDPNSSKVDINLLGDIAWLSRYYTELRRFNIDHFDTTINKTKKTSCRLHGVSSKQKHSPR